MNFPLNSVLVSEYCVIEKLKIGVSLQYKLINNEKVNVENWFQLSNFN